MRPKYPIYLPSKGRSELRYTSNALNFMKVPHYIVVEEQEYKQYVDATIGTTATILVLDPEYKKKYELCDDKEFTLSTGPGPARNFIWDHSISNGFSWHWTMDDNIYNFLRLNNNLKIKMADGTCFRVMEDFCDRYENVAMAGPQYRAFAPQNSNIPPYVINTRIYSCNLIRNDVPFRWRGRYNEDTILSLDMLKAGWCTIQFNAFLQDKMRTQTIGGGNTQEFYANEGTIRKSVMLKEVHPDVTELVWKFGREHHYVNYNPFKSMTLRRKSGIVLSDQINDYGMKIKTISKNYPNRV
jgi:hypothetical protein